MIHAAACPVLTIGPEIEPRSRSEFHPKHILFATDASADSFRALPHAILFARKQGSDLALVHVLSMGHEGTPEADAFAALMQDALHRALPISAMRDCRPEIMVRFGNPIEEILKAARERGSELIVMGARSTANRSTFSRSVSYGVIAQAPCPVLTVRGRK
jgi:nucleotide-binding universal stress UspA family protein